MDDTTEQQRSQAVGTNDDDALQSPSILSGDSVSLPADISAEDGGPKKRQKCGHCGRPSHGCVCSTMPKEPLSITGRILVLQHPHEKKRKLATVPLLGRCLKDCHVKAHRRFPEHVFSELDLAIEQAKSGQCPLYLLFPGPGAVDLADAMSHPRSSGTTTPSKDAPAYTLAVIDGTWQQAHEMLRAVAPRIMGVSENIVQVKLPDPPPAHKGSGDESDEAPAMQLPLRVEPQEGCVTTMEAVARALHVLEGKPRGVEVMGAIMAPLEFLVNFQAQYDPAIRARLEGNVHMKKTKRSHRVQRPRNVDWVNSKPAEEDPQ